MITIIESISTANPPYCVLQNEAALSMQKVEGFSPGLRKRIPLVYSLSGIDQRYTCVRDYFTGRPEEFDFFPQNWSLSPAPSTGTRNKKYKESVLPMAKEAATKALEQSHLDAAEITHLIAVTCTGFFAPGIDIHLVKELGLPPSTARTVIGFMGCYAAFNALRAADAICQSQTNARVLVVCAELCSLHFQIKDSLESVVVNAIFADGAAVAVISARTETEAQGKLAYASGHCLLDDDSMGHMNWEIGDTGFLMGLSSKVPDVLARQLPPYIDQILAKSHVKRSEIDFWAIHPGGRQIVEKAQQVLDLSEAEVADSFAVLKGYGNMSAPTILFILKRIMERRAKGEDLRTGIALAFGPGLTIEGCLFREV
ncbi:MAG TPA: type III polyketide synthase [Capsulimonadaceae bacterium]|nr:type III polyketide synthase [Capsulimonadaceae bacterium]